MIDLAGKRVLVIEDEWLIAADLARALAAAGARLIGPVGDLATGLRRAEEPLDAAVLDVNLDGTRSFPVADRLAGRGIPFVFVTGYDGWALPDHHRHAPRITKPFAPGRAVEAIGALLGGHRA